MDETNGCLGEIILSTQVKKHLVQNYHIMKANTARESAVNAPCCLYFDTRWRWVVSFIMLRLLCFQEEYLRFW